MMPKNFFVPNRLLSARIRRKTLVMTVAVKILITIPIISVSAKPLTSPEPNSYSATLAMSVVTCESIIVPSALL